jgi:hypothetical protein
MSASSAPSRNNIQNFGPFGTIYALFSPLTRITAVGHHPIKKLTDVERGEGQYRLDCAAFGSGTTSTETRLCFSPAVFGERIRIGNAPAALGFIPTKVRKLS